MPIFARTQKVGLYKKEKVLQQYLLSPTVRFKILLSSLVMDSFNTIMYSK